MMAKTEKNKNLYKLVSNYMDPFETLCSSLKYLGISHFSYYKIINDDKAIYFCTHKKWHDSHYVKEDGFSGIGRRYIQSQVIFTGNPNQEIFHPNCPLNGAEMFENNLWNSICFYEMNKNCFESFNFFGTNDNTELVFLFLKKKFLFQKFISYFQSEFRKIIKPIDLGSFAEIRVDKKSQESNANSMEIEQFIQKTPLEKSPIFTRSGDLIFLTKQQSALMKFMIQGLPVKMVEEELGIKPKTAEFYWSNIKKKCEIKESKKIIKSFLDAQEFIDFRENLRI